MASRTKANYSPETQRKAKVALELRRRAQAHIASLPIWKAISAVQLDAIRSPADELYYGGAAGGGKTDLLIGLAVTEHHRSIIFRREFPQLSAIIQRTKDILLDPLNPAIQALPERPKYNSTEHVWNRLPGGRRLEFGAMKNEDDKKRYQGRPHDLKAWDEVPHFSQSQFTYCNAWNRTVIPNQRFRVVAAGNPPMAPEEMWIVDYWGAWLKQSHEQFPTQPGFLRFYATVGKEVVEVEDNEPFWYDGLKIIPRSRTFIPAHLSDNPLLMDAGYASVLQGLPEPMRSQLLFGDFNIRPLDDVWQVIPTAWVIAAQARWKAQPGRQTTLTQVGVDVSRGGKDQTVIALRYANWYDRIIAHPGSETPDGVEAARHVIRALGLNPDALKPAEYEFSAAADIPINVDVLGPGASALDILVWAGLSCWAVHFGAPTKATDITGQLAMVNIRAEAYWRFREALDPVSGQDICLPDDQELLVELTAAKWFPTRHGVQLEEKDSIAERIGRSPDRADAVVMGWLDMASKKPPQPPTSTSHRQFQSDNPVPSEYSAPHPGFPPGQPPTTDMYQYNPGLDIAQKVVQQYYAQSGVQSLSPEQLYDRMQEELRAQSYTEHVKYKFGRKK